MFTHTQTYTHTHTHTHTRIVYIYTYISIYRCVCLCVCVYLCVFVFVCVCYLEFLESQKFNTLSFSPALQRRGFWKRHSKIQIDKHTHMLALALPHAHTHCSSRIHTYITYPCHNGQAFHFPGPALNKREHGMIRAHTNKHTHTTHTNTYRDKD